MISEYEPSELRGQPGPARTLAEARFALSVMMEEAVNSPPMADEDNAMFAFACAALMEAGISAPPAKQEELSGREDVLAAFAFAALMEAGISAPPAKQEERSGTEDAMAPFAFAVLMEAGAGNALPAAAAPSFAPSRGNEDVMMLFAFAVLQEAAAANAIRRRSPRRLLAAAKEKLKARAFYAIHVMYQFVVTRPMLRSVLKTLRVNELYKIIRKRF